MVDVITILIVLLVYTLMYETTTDEILYNDLHPFTQFFFTIYIEDMGGGGGGGHIQMYSISRTSTILIFFFFLYIHSTERDGPLHTYI